MNSIIFQIQTIPDIEAGRQLYGLQGLNDKDVARAIGHLRHQKSGSETQPLHLQRIVAISVQRASTDDMILESLGTESSTEEELLNLFYEKLECSKAALISWGGNGFQWPVIHLRSLLYAISSPHYWNSSDAISRASVTGSVYQYGQHTDLSNVLAGAVAEPAVMLSQLAALAGISIMHSETETLDYWLQGDIGSIRNRCELDVVSLFLLYLRFERMRGRMMQIEYEQHIARLRDVMSERYSDSADLF